MPRIESLLSARLFLAPQIIEKRIFFLSNISGKISLFSMNHGGSVPEPLLPAHIALQNPLLMEGHPYYVFPKAGKILVMIDKDGDEYYQPMLIPIDGGFPEPAFGDRLSDYRIHLSECDPELGLVYLDAESRLEENNVAFQGNIETGELINLGESLWGAHMGGASEKHDQVVLIDGYTLGDHVIYLWGKKTNQCELLFGTPIDQRAEESEIILNSITKCTFTKGEGLLFSTSFFEDTYGLGYLKLEKPGEIREVTVSEVVHQGVGELIGLDHLVDDRFTVAYNIDGCSWLYEGSFDENTLIMHIDQVICGQGELSSGVLEHAYYDYKYDRHVLTFSTAKSPTQIYTVEGKKHDKVLRHTNEKVLGIPDEWLASGEDASFVSYDGTRISARLYLPGEKLAFNGPRPVVYYVHGGPQSQERPDFAWFSMPLIQFLTISGFAVFVPNVRGSSGYGLSFTKQVERDWGGNDRLDHVFAMTEVLPKDMRLNTKRAGVVGRSYGGYMSLTLASRHQELWSAAVDMFGPYDLLTFLDRIPPTWKPFFILEVGDPEKDRELLVERSPRTYMENISCPLLVIQGKNDPRVVERESHDVVEHLRAKGKQVEYLVFENEGHDVLKYENRVTCYNAITDFFKNYLKP